MATELVNLATSEKLTAVDWTKNIEICELVAQDQRQAKDVIKAIKKRLGNKHPNVQLYAVSLLEMLMNNIGEPIHKQVVDAGLLPLLVKLVKKKSDLSVRERIFLLLDATQTSVGGAKGRFPQYYDAYYELVNAGVQFPQTLDTISSGQTASGTAQTDITVREVASVDQERTVPQEEPQPQIVPESSIIQKATTALEVLREVLDAVDPQKPEAGKDEFTLDLVEQCSFQKQQVMHLIMTSRDERLVFRAIELNEQLERLLARHDALSLNRPRTTPNRIDHERVPLERNDAANSARLPSMSNHIEYEEAESEDEAEQLTRRIRKGKARLRPEDEEEGLDARPLGSFKSGGSNDKLNRPLIRPLTIDPPSKEPKPPSPTVSIPPPPSKHMEREKFFQERKGDATALAGPMGGLSLHSRNPSSSAASHSGSTGSNE